MSEKSKLQGMLSAKCPVCKTGDMFPVSVVSYRKLTDVNPTCAHCQANLMPEPDFYYGAMYISYAFSVALFVAVGVALYVIHRDPETWMYLTAVVVFNILLLPLMLRYS